MRPTAANLCAFVFVSLNTISFAQAGQVCTEGIYGELVPLAERISAVGAYCTSLLPPSTTVVTTTASATTVTGLAVQVSGSTATTTSTASETATVTSTPPPVTSTVTDTNTVTTTTTTTSTVSSGSTAVCAATTNDKRAFQQQCRLKISAASWSDLGTTSSTTTTTTTTINLTSSLSQFPTSWAPSSITTLCSCIVTPVITVTTGTTPTVTSIPTVTAAPETSTVTTTTTTTTTEVITAETSSTTTTATTTTTSTATTTTTVPAYTSTIPTSATGSTAGCDCQYTVKCATVYSNTYFLRDLYFSNLQDCITACDGYSNCIGSQYNTRSGECVLVKSAGGTEAYSDHAVAIKGSCSNTGGSQCVAG